MAATDIRVFRSEEEKFHGFQGVLGRVPDDMTKVAEAYVEAQTQAIAAAAGQGGP